MNWAGGRLSPGPDVGSLILNFENWGKKLSGVRYDIKHSGRFAATFIRNSPNLDSP